MQEIGKRKRALEAEIAAMRGRLTAYEAAKVGLKEIQNSATRLQDDVLTAAGENKAVLLQEHLDYGSIKVYWHKDREFTGKKNTCKLQKVEIYSKDPSIPVWSCSEAEYLAIFNRLDKRGGNHIGKLSPERLQAFREGCRQRALLREWREGGGFKKKAQ